VGGGLGDRMCGGSPSADVELRRELLFRRLEVVEVDEPGIKALVERGELGEDGPLVPLRRWLGRCRVAAFDALGPLRGGPLSSGLLALLLLESGLAHDSGCTLIRRR